MDFAQMIAAGGRLWENYGKRRVYFNDLISRVEQPEDMTKNERIRFRNSFGMSKAYYDLDAKKFVLVDVEDDYKDEILESIKADIEKAAGQKILACGCVEYPGMHVMSTASGSSCPDCYDRMELM